MSTAATQPQRNSAECSGGQIPDALLLQLERLEADSEQSREFGNVVTDPAHAAAANPNWRWEHKPTLHRFRGKQQTGSQDQSKQDISVREVPLQHTAPVPEHQIEWQASKTLKGGRTPPLEPCIRISEQPRNALREDLDEHSVGSPLRCDAVEELPAVTIKEVPRSKRLVNLARSRLSKPITAVMTPLNFMPNWVTDEVERSDQNTEEEADDFQTARKRKRVENETQHMDTNIEFLPGSSVAS
ncbi:hypothetical protein R1sor_004855 [Riccia sorocarpa]|uniref:Uncharacterized protein n=1 Tax=Riccia sorocarpa TaxID=122646 RepID=A0ABD3HPB4_9MARC